MSLGGDFKARLREWKSRVVCVGRVATGRGPTGVNWKAQPDGTFKRLMRRGWVLKSLSVL